MGLSREIEREKERGDQCVNPGILQSSPVKNGGVGKRLTPAVLKTVRPERVSWVRIPPPPPNFGLCFQFVGSLLTRLYPFCTARFCVRIGSTVQARATSASSCSWRERTQGL